MKGHEVKLKIDAEAAANSTDGRVQEKMAKEYVNFISQNSVRKAIDT